MTDTEIFLKPAKFRWLTTQPRCGHSLKTRISRSQVLIEAVQIANLIHKEDRSKREFRDYTTMNFIIDVNFILFLPFLLDFQVSNCVCLLTKWTWALIPYYCKYGQQTNFSYFILSYHQFLTSCETSVCQQWTEKYIRPAAQTALS